MIDLEKQEHEIDKLGDYIKSLEYDFVNAKTFAERKQILLDWKEAQSRLRWLNLGVF